jgi:thioredoxin-like negative regulator of GroEL
MAIPPSDTVILRCKVCEAMNRVPIKRLSRNPLCGNCKTLLDFPLKPVPVSSSTFEKEMSEWPEALLLMLCSKSSSDCAAVEPAVQDIAFFRAGQLKVLKIDIDEDPSIATLYAVRITPTLLCFRNGQQVGRLEGAPKEQTEISLWIKKNLAI